MKMTCDAATDILRIELSRAPVEECDEDKPCVIVDYDKDGNIVGIKVLDGSKRVENPKAMEYAVTG